MALSPKQDNNSNGFTPTVARPTPAIPGVSQIPNLGGGGDENRGPRAESRKQLIVGPEIELQGHIAACESLVVEGTVLAELNDNCRLEITETGTFKGTVQVDDAMIAGHFDGDLTVRRKLTVMTTGRIVGTIRYAELEIEAGGQISGSVELMEQQTSAPAQTTPLASDVADSTTGAEEDGDDADLLSETD